MTALPLTDIERNCVSLCESAASAEELNRACFCLGVDAQALQHQLESELGANGLPRALADSHPHLFSALPVFVSPRHLEQTASVVAAIEAVTATPAWRAAVLAWAPPIARFDPGSPGGILGLDFHFDAAGPRLIEINTNPGGVLLNALLGRAQRACVPHLVLAPRERDDIETQVLQSLLSEWQQQRGDRALRFVAIVDAAPEAQYLYPEFLLFRALFERHGLRAEICDPARLTRAHGQLWLGEHPVDLVYNRLTDFGLSEPAHAVLRAAYLAREVALTPHPHAHARYADKRNLILLGDRAWLRASGIETQVVDTLAAAVPRTELLTPENRDALWARRRELFFKPAAGYGSKHSYRGDKLTRRVWDEISGGTHVAQEVVAPGHRHIEPDSAPLKFDLRCYAYRGQVLLYAARLYQGQTTNFRTQGGGFSPVLTSGVAC
jgi:hypothetical protein